MGVGIQVNDFFDFQEACYEVDRHYGRRNDSLLSLSARFVVPLNSGQLREMHNQMRREVSDYLAIRRLSSNYVYLLTAAVIIIGGFIVSVAVLSLSKGHSGISGIVGLGVIPSSGCLGKYLLHECCMDREEGRYQDRLLDSFNRVIAYANLTPDRSDTIQNWYSQFTAAVATT